MVRRWLLGGLGLLTVAWLLQANSEPPTDELLNDAAILRSHQIQPTVEELARYFRSKIPSSALLEQLSRDSRALGDPDYEVREAAQKALQKAGPLAIGPLRTALQEADAEIVRRAMACLSRIDRNRPRDLPGAAARQLVRLNPEVASEVILAYLPFAESDEAIEEVSLALRPLARLRGATNPHFVKALSDASPIRRACGAKVMAAALDSPELTKSVRLLLRDPAPLVRLQAALALAANRDRLAIPTLIDLLGELPTEKCWPAELLLTRLADDSAPDWPRKGSTQERRIAYRDAWRDWWQRHSHTVNLNLLGETPQTRGYTLIAELVRFRGANSNGRAYEIAEDGSTVRWNVDNLRMPVDLCLVRSNRLLVAEFSANQVTERDLAGQILWSRDMIRPLGVQKLANGNLFLASRTQLIELTPDGRELYNWDVLHLGLQFARKTPDGLVVGLTSRGECVWLDGLGRELRRFESGRPYTFCRFDILPGNRVLIPQYYENQVVEFDSMGKQVWSTSVGSPVSAERLPNGRTLVTSRSRNSVIEVDANGREVWEYKTESTPWAARRR